MATEQEEKESTISIHPVLTCWAVALRSGWYALYLMTLSVVALLEESISFLPRKKRRRYLGQFQTAFWLVMTWSRIYGKLLVYLESLPLASTHDDSLKDITLSLSLT